MIGDFPVLSSEQRTRYSRHILLPEFGMKGQQRLLAARVLVIGAGGLGCPVAQYLAAAGVGEMTLVDADQVDLTNLQRQILYRTEDVGRSKVATSAANLRAMNPDVKVREVAESFGPGNAEQLVAAHDLVIDASDNFATRFLVNDVCVKLAKPFVHGSVYRFEGQAALFDPRTGPCYRCVFPQPPRPEAVPNCAEGGVLGVVPGMVGMVQATEAIKFLAELGDSHGGRMFIYDALSMRVDSLRIHRDPNCAACGASGRIACQTEVESKASSTEVCTRADADTSAVQWIGSRDLAASMATDPSLQMIDVRSPGEFAICSIPDSRNVPLAVLSAHVPQILPTGGVILVCKSGARAARAAVVLRAAGVPGARVLRGGILAWIRDVDPGLATY